MKKLFSLFALLFILSLEVAKAQGSLNQYKEMDSKMLDSYVSILKADEHGIIALKTKTKGAMLGAMVSMGVKAEVFIDQFDSDLNLVKSTFLDGYTFEVLNQVNNSVEFMYLSASGKLLLGSSTFENEVSKLILNQIDINSGKTTSSKVIYEAKGIDRRGTYRILSSTNSENIGFFSHIGTDKKNYETSLLYGELSKDFDLIWSNTIVLPFFSKVSTSNISNLATGEGEKYKDGVLLLPEGQFLFNFKIQEKDFKKSGRNEYYNTLFTLGRESSSLQIKVLANDNKEYIKDLGLLEEQDGSIVLVGTYGNENNSVNQGRYFAKLDPKTMTLTNEKFTPFVGVERKNLILSFAKLFEFDPEKAQKDASKLDHISYFTPKSLSLNSRGNVVLYSEFEQVLIVEERTGVMVSKRLDVKGGDIYKQEFDTTGELISTEILSKNTYSPVGGFNRSFQLRKVEENDLFFYADESKSQFFVEKIDPFGKITKRKLADMKEDKRYKGVWFTCYSDQLVNDRYLYAFVRDKFKQGLVKFDLASF